MLVVVSYDISGEDKGAKRLRKVAKVCQNYGSRVQFSVFECLVEPAEWTGLRHKLESIINLEKDCLRFYFLGSNWKRRIEHIGIKKAPEFEEPLIV